MNANAAAPLHPAPEGPQQLDAAGDARSRELVLLGAGLAHLQMLKALPAQPIADMRITLVAPYPRTVLPNLLPTFVAGDQLLDAVAIALEPLVRKAQVRWLPRHIRAIDAKAQTITLDDDSTQDYDWLSINTGPAQNREQIDLNIPGARENGLFVHPLESFATLWPKVCELASERPLRVAILGSGAAVMELALAVRKRLPHASVTLITGQPRPAALSVLQQRLQDALKAQRITLLHDTALSMNATHVQLGCGAALACDVPIVAIDGQTPAWIQGSGMALDPAGQVRVDAFQRSASHPQIFVPQDDSDALRPNLAAAMAGMSLQPASRPHASLQLLFAGAAHAVGSWGPYSAQGRWVGWLKSWHDRKTLARYTEATL